MKCIYCNNKLERKWNFCPKCGRRVEKRIGLFDLVNKIFSNEYEPKRAHEIVINLSPSQTDSVFSTKVNDKPYKKRMKFLKKKKFSGAVAEPDAEIKNFGNKIIATLEIPGIESVHDIQINRIYNSSEIRAFGKDKNYFKILNIPKEYRLIKKKLKKDNLELHFKI